VDGKRQVKVTLRGGGETGNKFKVVDKEEQNKKKKLKEVERREVMLL